MVDFSSVILDYEKEATLFGNNYVLNEGMDIAVPSANAITITEINRLSNRSIVIRYRYTNGNNTSTRGSLISNLERDIERHAIHTPYQWADPDYMQAYDPESFMTQYQGHFHSEPRRYTGSTNHLGQQLLADYQDFFNSNRGHYERQPISSDLITRIKSDVDRFTEQVVHERMPLGVRVNANSEVSNERRGSRYSENIRIQVSFNFMNPHVQEEPIIIGIILEMPDIGNMVRSII